MRRRLVHQKLDQTSAYNRMSWGAHYLRQGFLRDGWELYQARLEIPGHPSQWLPSEAPSWDGIADLAGRRLLVGHEQGFGDIVWMLRFVPRLVGLGAHVILALPDPLLRLARCLPGVAQVIGDGGVFDDVDYHVSLMSLTYLLRVRPNTIPATVPYLTPPPETQEAWRARLGPKTRPRVGLSCSGRANDTRDARRTIPLHMFVPLLTTHNVDFHLVQNHVRPSDEAALAALPGLYTHTEALTDLAEVAALILQMDIVVSVCTVAAHLAGALGVPTWIALSTGAYFLWMEGRTDSPWYPTARLFRQSEPDVWPPVIERMATELRALL